MEESGSFFQKLAYQKLDKKFASLSRHANYVSWDKADKISILFDGTDLDVADFAKKVSREFAQEGKRVEILGFGGKKGESIFDFPVFYKAKFGSFVPQGDTVETFIARDADILFVFSYKRIYEIDYILALSKAKLKIGTWLFEKYADMIFRVNDGTLESFLVKALEFSKNIKS